MTNNQDVRFIVSTIRNVVKNAYKKDNQYFLKDVQVMLDELLQSTSKVACLLYFNEIDPQLMHKIEEAYELFVWIINKIKPQESLFDIKDIKSLNHTANNLITLVNSLSPAFDAPDLPFSKELMINRTQEIINSFESLGSNRNNQKTTIKKDTRGKKMEHLGKSFLLVVDPSNFDMKKNQVLYKDFGFVICTESQFFRDSMEKLCKKCHEIRQRGMSSKFITRIRKRMKRYTRTPLKSERDYLELVALYFDLAYYTATTQDKNTHLRKFTTILGLTPYYFLYIGSKPHTSFELFKKVQEKTNAGKINDGVGSFINIIQLLN